MPSSNETPSDANSTAQPSTISAEKLLAEASDTIADRAALRDHPNGERSMARTVATFNAMYGTQLTELQGWQFMVLLKMARGAGGSTHMDDYTDQAAYSVLAGECALRPDDTVTGDAPSNAPLPDH